MMNTLTSWQKIGQYEHEYAQNYLNSIPVGVMYYTGRYRAATY